MYWLEAADKANQQWIWAERWKQRKREVDAHIDEPTAHLDRINEYAMMHTLMTTRGDRTLLVVAHQLSTVQQADQILVIDSGRIIARGTHDELLERSADYQRLVQHDFADSIPTRSQSRSSCAISRRAASVIEPDNDG